MKFSLREDALSRTLIAAHRGTWGGNIMCNTPQAFECALMQGADMIELDLTPSADGELFVFHPGMEKVFLGTQTRLETLPSSEVRKLRYLNVDKAVTEWPICPFDDALEQLKGRCYINVDKFWDNLAGATEAVRRHRMEEQVLVKTGPREDVLDWMEQNAPDINYMAILREKDEFTPIARRRKINYVGVEALFATEDVPIASPEYVRSMNRQGMLVWINTIVYNYKAVLAAGHSDDTAVSGDPDTGWGWLLKQGYNIIQTDFPQMLRQYMEAFRGNGRG